MKRVSDVAGTPAGFVRFGGNVPVVALVPRAATGYKLPSLRLSSGRTDGGDRRSLVARPLYRLPDLVSLLESHSSTQPQLLESHRDSIAQPRVARHELPWDRIDRMCQP